MVLSGPLALAWTSVNIGRVREMKAKVSWLNNAMFLGESGSGHTVVMDGPETSGGRNIGVRPMEMLLLGVGGCACFDVVSILEKSRQQVLNCDVEVVAERVDETPAVFKTLHLHFIISGKQLKEKQVQRAVVLSADKYCSASIMLQRSGAIVSHDYEIVEIP